MITQSRANVTNGVYSTTINKVGTGTEFAIIRTDGLYRPGVTNFGIQFTLKSTAGSGGSATLYSTTDLVKQAINMKPSAQAGVHWDSEGTITEGTPLTSDRLCSAFKIAFPAGNFTLTVTSL